MTPEECARMAERAMEASGPNTWPTDRQAQLAHSYATLGLLLIEVERRSGAPVPIKPVEPWMDQA